jgi:fluoride ion exporter CrcB/FEX
MTPLDVRWVGLGGGLGSLLRWWSGRLAGGRCHSDFSLGKSLINSLINVTGAFAMSYLSVLFMVEWACPPRHRARFPCADWIALTCLRNHHCLTHWSQ